MRPFDPEAEGINVSRVLRDRLMESVSILTVWVEERATERITVLIGFIGEKVDVKVALVRLEFVGEERPDDCDPDEFDTTSLPADDPREFFEPGVSDLQEPVEIDFSQPTSNLGS